MILIFPLDLEDIKEVGPRGMDLNEISIRRRNRSRKSSGFQIEGRLLELVQQGERVNIYLIKGNCENAKWTTRVKANLHKPSNICPTVWHASFLRHSRSNVSYLDFSQKTRPK